MAVFFSEKLVRRANKITRFLSDKRPTGGIAWNLMRIFRQPVSLDRVCRIISPGAQLPFWIPFCNVIDLLKNFSAVTVGAPLFCVGKNKLTMKPDNRPAVFNSCLLE